MLQWAALGLLLSTAGVITLSLSPQERILARFSELSPNQQRLARFLLDHEAELAFASVNAVSEQAGTSPATVVRLCRALGYDGYTALQAAIRAQLPQYRTIAQKLADQMANGGFSDNLPAQIAQANSQNIQTTLSQVAAADLNEVVTAIIQARAIYVFGSGLSAAAATLAEYALSMLGLPARACLHGGVAQMLEVSRLGQDDLVIVIAIWRYLRHEVEAVNAARMAGVTCLVITDSPLSPIANLADYVFFAATEGAAHSRSLTGIISLIDLLSAAVAAKRAEQSIDALHRIDRLYREGGMLWGE